jgi:hypothetical protein
MKNRTLSVSIVVLMLAAVFLSACGGGGGVVVADLPVYPDAVALLPGDDPVADTLANNAEQDAALRTDLGVGGSVEQKAFRLPAGTTWDQVKTFFGGELEGDGWKSGLGGIGGDIASDALETANASNEYFQTAMWSKGKQNLTVIRSLDAQNPDQPYLILSLATN